MLHAHWIVLGVATLVACGGPARPADASTPVATVSADAPAPGVGDVAPAISLNSIDGSPLALARGKVTVLVFWATWSAPDKKELSELQELYQRRGPAKLAVIALSIDDGPAQLAEFAKGNGLRFPIAWDAQHRFAQRYRVPREPTTYVIDRNGVIRFIHLAYHDGEMKVIASEVESLAQ